MKIYSEFHDYYDQGTGIYDDSIVYIRKTQVLKLTKTPLEVSSFAKQMPSNRLGIYTNRTVLFFCGRLYPVWGSYNPDKKLTHARSRCVDVINYLININYSDDILSEYLQSKVSKPKRFSTPNFTLGNCRQFEEDISGKRVSLDLEVPIVLYEHYNFHKNSFEQITFNPRLSSLGFFTRFDVHMVYQEIEMWLNNLAQPDKVSITTGSDRVLAQSHGFDDTSFKTIAPGNKKVRRRSKKNG